MVIPLLVIAFKLLIPAELKNYYSSQKQAEAGNIDAMRFTTRRPDPQNDCQGGLPPPQTGVENVYQTAD